MSTWQPCNTNEYTVGTIREGNSQERPHKTSKHVSLSIKAGVYHCNVHQITPQLILFLHKASVVIGQTDPGEIRRFLEIKKYNLLR